MLETYIKNDIEKKNEMTNLTQLKNIIYFLRMPYLGQRLIKVNRNG